MRFEKSRKYIEGKFRRRADGSLESQNIDGQRAESGERRAGNNQQKTINRAQGTVNDVSDVNNHTIHTRGEGDEIGDVWAEQIRLKDEAKRLELEYQVAKKLTKELRQKVRDSKVSVSDDASFGDILSPETKNLVEKASYFQQKLQSESKKALQIAKNRLKIVKLAVKIANNKLNKSKYRRYKWAIPVPVVALILIIGVSFNSRDNSSLTDVKSANTNNIDRDIPLNVKPEFDVLKPAGKDIGQLGGFARVSPDSSAPAYAYVDIIGSTNIKVTQQQIPDKLKVNTEVELEKLANDFNANRSIQINETLAYIGKSEKGPQTVIFIKNGLLVFIAADNEISDVGWVQYVSQLNK